MPMNDSQPNRQSRTMSLVEALANLGVGYLLAVLTQAIVFPLFGVWMSIGATLEIAAILDPGPKTVRNDPVTRAARQTVCNRLPELARAIDPAMPSGQ